MPAHGQIGRGQAGQRLRITLHLCPPPELQPPEDEPLLQPRLPPDEDDDDSLQDERLNKVQMVMMAIQ